MPVPPSDIQEEDFRRNSYHPFYLPLIPSKTVDVNDHRNDNVFLARPVFGPLLFDNTASDARDHCANERTFLSYLRLSIYMSIVSLAIIMSFHLKSQPTPLELRMALPLGIVFWALGLVCLCLGLGNYMKTIEKYAKRMALVQTGVKTQLTFGFIALSIVAVCILFLSTNSSNT